MTAWIRCGCTALLRPRQPGYPRGAGDVATSICAVLLAEACNTGFEPLIRLDKPSLRRSRLSWVRQNYVRAETLTLANAALVAAQNRIDLARM